MNKRANYYRENGSVGILFFIVVILFPLVFQAQKITTKQENGITVVSNPKTPAPPPDTPVKLVLKEDFTIGVKEGDEKYMFLSARDIDVDDAGNIYVLDTKAAHIKVFDENGTFVKTIGKKGEGPGEAERPRFLQITLQEEIMVCDASSGRILFFDMSGKFLRKISIAKFTMFMNPKRDLRGNTVGSYMVFSDQPVQELKKFNEEMESILVINTLKMLKRPRIDARFPRQYWQINKDGSIIWGVNTRYELQVINPDGKVTKKIIKDYDPVSITKEYKEKWIKERFGEEGPMPGTKFVWGKHNLAFRDIRLDDEGRIFVQTYEKIGESSGGYYDIFDSEGRYIAKVFLEVEPLVWKKNKMYTIYEDGDGYRFIKRFSVAWE